MWVPNTSNQEGTMEMRNEVLPSVGAHDMEPNGYQVSDLDDVDFYWENDQLDVDAVFTTGIKTPFFHAIFNEIEMSSMAEHPILTHEEQYEENSPPAQ